MEHNNKINDNEEYKKEVSSTRTEFSMQTKGWAIVSQIDNDFKFVENYLGNSIILNKYFSPLPSSSYNVVLYKLNRRIKGFPIPSLNLKKIERPDYIEDSFYKIQFECKNKGWVKLKLIIKDIYIGDNNIEIVFKQSEEKKIINIFQNNILDICGGEEEYMNNICCHMTLAYNYKKIDENDMLKIKEEINLLKLFLTNQSITLRTPDIYYFSDIKTYVSMFDIYKNRSKKINLFD